MWNVTPDVKAPSLETEEVRLENSSGHCVSKKVTVRLQSFAYSKTLAGFDTDL